MLLNRAKLFSENIEVGFFPVKIGCPVFLDQSKVLEVLGVFAEVVYFNVMMYYWGGGAMEIVQQLYYIHFYVQFKR